MSRISDIEAATLGLLYENSYYGYELEKIIERWGTCNWIEIGFSSITTSLKVEGKLSRKIHTITDDVKLVVKEKIRELLSNNAKFISPFEMGIADMGALNNEGVINCIIDCLKSIDMWIKFFEDFIEVTGCFTTPYNVIALFSHPLLYLKTEKNGWKNL